MKKQTRVLAIALALTIVMTGCNLLPGTGEGQSESAQPLDAAAWPTPQPTAVQASPTPFPKITLALTPTPTARPPSGAISPTPIAAEELTFTGDVGALVQQVTQLSGGFPPTAAAMIKANEATLRQGPGDSYDPVGIAPAGELAAVLGKDASGDWMYVLTRSVLQGWLPSDALQITFSLGEAPTLPADPMAGKPAQMEAYASVSNDFLGGLEPIAVALVTTQAVTVRQGPATTYASAGMVEQGELAGILGTNASRDWLYVVTISVVQGWLPADSVRVMGSLAEAPMLPANPLAAGIPSLASSPPSATSSSPTNTTITRQPLELANLDPVTTARVNNNGLNLRQGPGAAYELLGTLSRDEEVSVLAINKSRDWLLVKTVDGNFGWVSLEYLVPDGSLADVPQVISPAPDRDIAPGQVAPVFPEGAESSSVVDTETQTVAAITHIEPASASSLAVSRLDLTPVATARAKRANVDLFRGPAVSYAPIVTLSIDEHVSVLAHNQDRDWLLVKPVDTYKSPGWVPAQDLIVAGSLANAPQVTTAWVDSNELAVRRGPGIFHEQIGALAINDLVAVLGRNQGESWSLVQPILGGAPGWIPIHFLTLTGSWSNIPLAPATPLAAADTSSRPAGRSTTETGISTARPGKIVFQLSSGGDIMVINPDGTDLRRLTHGIDPALSPDGQTVAFTRWTGEDGALWLINADGSNERAVLGGTKQAKHPSWSPDGQRIVVNFQHGGRLEPKKVCKNLIKLGDKNPSIPWNVDPDTIGVEIDNGLPYLCWTLPPDPHWGLRVVNLTDGSFDDVPSDAYAFGPEWDPAHPWRIVSSGLNGLVQLDVNRSEQWALTERGEDHTPAFAPDGRHIAAAFNNHGHYNIHLMSSDGRGRVPLTETPLWVTAQPGEQKAWNNVSPTWSPDGSRIAFLTDRTGRWEIWAMSADGSNQHPMFSDEVNDQLQITYGFVDERVVSWR
jgi:TolB protein